MLAQAGIDRKEASLMLSHVLAYDESEVLAHPERILSSNDAQRFDSAIQKRVAGYPVAQITGHSYFYGLRFRVDEHTLIPRPESELLVEEAVDFLKKHPRSRVLDMGTGSGNIIIAIAHSLRGSLHSFYAADISRSALAVAKKNAHEHHVRVRFYCSNLLQNVPRLKFDLIIANLPYLTAEQLTEPSIKYEPVGALWGGTRGIELYRHFFNELNPYLSSHGTVCIEIDPDQKNELTELAWSYFPSATIDCLPDLSGRPRVIRIQHPGPDTRK